MTRQTAQCAPAAGHNEEKTEPNTSMGQTAAGGSRNGVLRQLFSLQRPDFGRRWVSGSRTGGPAANQRQKKPSPALVPECSFGIMEMNEYGGGETVKYGHFDNERREYVIDRVDVPVSWTNYLGVEDLCAVVNHTAG